MDRSQVLRLFSPLLLTLVVAGCDSGEESKPSTDDSSPFVDTYVPPVDGDSDGQTVADGDCDDADASVFTGQVETCNGKDDNCNDLTDEGFPDADGDGIPGCAGDTEECDGLDNDDDGQIDEDFADSDGDGVADCVGTESCDGLDNDEDGLIDEGYDADGDGYTQCGTSTVAADCDDANPAVNPGATEDESDGIDNDCDGMIDAPWTEGLLSITEVMTNPQAVADPYGEWIELRNDSSATLTLNGLRFVGSDGDAFTISSSSAISLAPGEFFVVGANANPSLNGGVEVDYAWSAFSLGNESDDVTIWAGSVMVDSLSWDDGATMPDEAGASMSLDNIYYGASSNDNPAYWCASIEPWSANGTGDKGSPGVGNELCSTTDHDGDGYSIDQGDCDDEDITRYPGAPEIDPAVDNDCDGVAEWGPTAFAAATGSGYSCDWVQLSSAGSYDPNGEALSYSWSLVSAPSGSTRTSADIESQTSANPRFNPDVDGTYTFSLTVTDPGGANSTPVTTSVTTTARPSNTAPVANAGSDQSTSSSADCQPVSYGASYDCDACANAEFTLSAASSSDADNDVLTYAWAITSGGSYGSLDSSTDESVTLTFSGAMPTYGSAQRTTVTVELTTTDCMGATDTDTVDVHYDCTGY